MKFTLSYPPPLDNCSIWDSMHSFSSSLSFTIGLSSVPQHPISKGSVSSQWHYWEEMDFKRSLQRDKLLKDCGIPVLPDFVLILAMRYRVLLPQSSRHDTQGFIPTNNLKATTLPDYGMRPPKPRTIIFSLHKQTGLGVCYSMGGKLM